MRLQALWDWMEKAIFPLPSTGGKHPLFNFYLDEEPLIDCPTAAHLRRQNLQHYLERFTAPPLWLAVGEAPGWRGARFSGAPFTSEALLLSGELGFTGQPTGRTDRPLSEASATLFWQTLVESREYKDGVLAWNCLPFHPHQPGDPRSNRCPTRAEIRSYLPLLVEMIDLLHPQGIIAVGRSALSALAAAGIPAAAVRHPSHGGAKEFKSQFKHALGIEGDRL